MSRVPGGRMLVEPVIVAPKNFDELDAILDEIESDHDDALKRLADL